MAIPRQGWREVETPVGLDNVIIRRDQLAHIIEEGKGNREQFANYILPTLQEPLEVWLTEVERGGGQACLSAAFHCAVRGRACQARSGGRTRAEGWVCVLDFRAD